MAKLQFDEFLSSLCETVKRIRKEKGLTQGEVARRIGKPQPMVARFESGKINDTHISLIFHICEAIEEDVASVFSQALSQSIVNNVKAKNDLSSRWTVLKGKVDLLKEPKKSELVTVLEGIFKLM